LLIYMDGKDGAQNLLDKVLKDPALLSALSSARQESEQPAMPDGSGGGEPAES
jgi:type VI secretion system protein ImpB